MTLARPDYIERDPIGRMIRLYCKVCGKLIGMDRRGGFHRLHNYGELKMKFLDGSDHVTNLCHDCIPLVAKSRELMMEVYQADVDDMGAEMPAMRLLKFKLAPKFVVANLGRDGTP